jgi:acetyl-CoA carboxylase biotin carboxyl carrier protein
MDLRKIKALIDLLDKSNLAELEIKEGEESVRLARHSSAAPQMMMQAPPMQVQMHRGEHHASRPRRRSRCRPWPPPPPRRRPSQGRRARRPHDPFADGRHLLRLAEPGLAALREGRPDREAGRDAGHHRGDEDVQSDRGEVSGTVRAILVTTGQPIEFDEPMFVIG